MNIIFRVDASDEIGAGHIVRCQVLASELIVRGHQCLFVCLDLIGNHISLLKKRGFSVFTVLPKINYIEERLVEKLKDIDI